MCGFSGILSKHPSSTSDLKASLKSILHRGPDYQGIWEDEHLKIGHTRLSILDLSPLGNQPMSYQNGQLQIIFNGEIYNYIEIKEELIGKGYSFISHSDTEVLIAAYACW
ncbi:MAG: asparagine synthetase B, partial [Nostocales cyanobacterium]